MTPGRQSTQALRIESAKVKERLTEAEETLRAIRGGEVDALVVREGSSVPQVFALSSADRPYRLFVENMRDGAATVSASGVILYANRRLAELLAVPSHDIAGSPITSFIPYSDRARLREISSGAGGGGTIEVELFTGDGSRIPVLVNGWPLDLGDHELICLTFADLRQQKVLLREIDRLGAAQARRMRELEEAEASLIERATHDALTGLANRHLVIDRLTKALALGQRSGEPTGLIFVDIDRLKGVNDTRGHAAGDSLLRQVATRLLVAVRPMDSVARLGGDEFVVLLPALQSPQDAIAVGARIAAVLDAPIELDHGAIPVSASIGISVVDPSAEPEVTADRLLQQADTAMYRAKSLGGSRIELFDSGTSTFEAAQEDWSARIREALDQDRFVLYMQPIVELATGATVQHELLLRMRDQDNGVVLPEMFLPAAERSGLSGEIDRWVIQQAMKIVARGLRVAVNLSASSAGDPGILDLIERELLLHKANPSSLVFEITETAVMADIDRSRVFAERLVALGCRFALDDFGTGFASFTYLKRLPVQYLKIDIDFVRNLPHNRRDLSVIRAIVALASDFDQETIAEGVEDEHTVGILRELGVTFAQGYLFGAPRPVESDVMHAAVTSLQAAVTRNPAARI